MRIGTRDLILRDEQQLASKHCRRERRRKSAARPGWSCSGPFSATDSALSRLFLCHFRMHPTSSVNGSECVNDKRSEWAATLDTAAKTNVILLTTFSNITKLEPYFDMSKNLELHYSRSVSQLQFIDWNRDTPGIEWPTDILEAPESCSENASWPCLPTKKRQVCVVAWIILSYSTSRNSFTQMQHFTFTEY